MLTVTLEKSCFMFDFSINVENGRITPDVKRSATPGNPHKISYIPFYTLNRFCYINSI